MSADPPSLPVRRAAIRRVADLVALALWLSSAWVGIFGLGIGFCEDKVTFFVLRAVKGIGAAACIPSALHLIVHMFPRADDEHFALSVFGASGEVANVAGFILGGVLLVRFRSRLVSRS